MAHQNIVETALGALVLTAAIGFGLYVSSSTNDGNSGNAYSLYAKFRSADGIAVGSDVRLSGVKIGTVQSISLDTASFQAKLELSLNEIVKLPSDSSAKIESDGFLGGAHVTLAPGGSDEILAEKSEIIYTQGAVNMLDLLGKAVHGGVGVEP